MCEQTVFAEVYCAKKQRKIDTKQIAITGRLYLNFKAKSTRFRCKDGTFLFWIVPPPSFLWFSNNNVFITINSSQNFNRKFFIYPIITRYLYLLIDDRRSFLEEKILTYFIYLLAWIAIAEPRRPQVASRLINKLHASTLLEFPSQSTS